MVNESPRIKKSRIEAFFERVNEVIGDTKTYVTVSGTGYDQKTYDPYIKHSIYEGIQIVAKENNKITPEMKAQDYHSLSHIMYSTLDDKGNMNMQSSKLWHWVEDGRIETLFGRKYIGSQSYFETEMLEEILKINPDSAENFVPLYMRRHILSKPYHEAYEKDFSYKYGKQTAEDIKKLLDEYAITTDPNRQYKLIGEIGQKMGIQMQNYNLETIPKYRSVVKASQEEADKLKEEIEAKIDAEKDSQKEFNSKTGRKESEPNKDDKENEPGMEKNKNSGPAPTHEFNKTEKEPYEMKDMNLNDVLDDMQKQFDSLKEEQIQEAIRDTEVAFEVQKYEDAEKIRISVERMLRDYRAGNVPEQDRKLRNGSLDIKRAMHPKERLDIFYKINMPYEGLDFNLQIYVDTSGSMWTGGYNKKTRADIALDVAKGITMACEKHDCPTEVIQFESIAEIVYAFETDNEDKYKPNKIGHLGGGTTLKNAMNQGIPRLKNMIAKNHKPGVIIIISDGYWECDCYYREHTEERYGNYIRTCTELERMERHDGITVAPLIFNDDRPEQLRHGLKDSRWIKDDLRDLNFEVKKLLDKVEQRVLGLRQ